MSAATEFRRRHATLLAAVILGLACAACAPTSRDRYYRARAWSFQPLAEVDSGPTSESPAAVAAAPE